MCGAHMYQMISPYDDIGLPDVHWNVLQFIHRLILSTLFGIRQDLSCSDNSPAWISAHVCISLAMLSDRGLPDWTRLLSLSPVLSAVNQKTSTKSHWIIISRLNCFTFVTALLLPVLRLGLMLPVPPKDSVQADGYSLLDRIALLWCYQLTKTARAVRGKQFILFSQLAPNIIISQKNIYVNIIVSVH